MQFLLLIGGPDHFARWDALTPDQVDDAMEGFRRFAKAAQERGTIVSGDAVAPPETARTVQAGPERLVTDGPFTESVEQLGGYYVIDVEDEDTAVELARLLPPYAAVEVRRLRGMEIR